MKISTKVALSNIVLGTTCVLAVMATVLVQHNRLRHEAENLARLSAGDQALQVAQTVLKNCIATENRNQRRLEHSLGVARDLLHRAGTFSLGAEQIPWTVINQFTKETSTVTLPAVSLGSTPVVRVTDPHSQVPVVDEATRLTREFCTIFQRINDAGDMLRIATSVVAKDGHRAVGTFIPARLPDGSDNPVVRAVLSGSTYRGRAFVVDDWHAAAYEPIWDANQSRVVGMLYVGIGLRDINRELRENILQIQLGRNGHVAVLGSRGNQRGHYLISPGGKRDGENLLKVQPASGLPYAETLLEAAAATSEGTAKLVRHGPTDPQDTTPGMRSTAVVAFPAWDWVICAEAKEEDFQAIVASLDRTQKQQILTACIVVMVVGSFGFFSSIALGRTIARPIAHAISTLGTSTGRIIDASEQLTGSGKALAEGAREQAASAEATSSSLHELAGMTQRNAESAHRANELARAVRQVTDQSTTDVRQLKSAMSDIQGSSRRISKIIETIDEIAFQTNLLALNAAVEAARAGEAGMGFAVVAEKSGASPNAAPRRPAKPPPSSILPFPIPPAASPSVTRSLSPWNRFMPISGRSTNWSPRSPPPVMSKAIR
jgi:methyl-accepting chemotaxis protein